MVRRRRYAESCRIDRFSHSLNDVFSFEESSELCRLLGHLFHLYPGFPLYNYIRMSLRSTDMQLVEESIAHVYKAKDSGSAPYPCGYDNHWLEVERKANTKWILRIGLDGEEC